jgi:hypothetical protein
LATKSATSALDERGPAGTLSPRGATGPSARGAVESDWAVRGAAGLRVVILRERPYRGHFCKHGGKRRRPQYPAANVNYR